MKKQIKQAVLSLLAAMGSVVLTSWLFFDFEPVSLLLLFYLPVAVFLRWKEFRRQRKWELNLAFKDALICMESSLAVGYSPESSVQEAVKHLEQLHGCDHEICLEFRRMVKQMELGTSMEEAFLEFGRRSEVEDIRQLADIFSIVKRTGGNLGQVFRQTGGVLQEKIELKRDLYTTMASRRMEFRMMLLMPHAILMYLKLCAPAMSEGLYHNAFGIVFLWCVLIAWFALKLWGEHVIRAETLKLEG